MTAITGVTSILEQISNASDEQDTGINEINRAMAQMDEMILRNSAPVEQAAVSANAPDEAARELMKSVSVFRIETA